MNKKEKMHIFKMYTEAINEAQSVHEMSHYTCKVIEDGDLSILEKQMLISFALTKVKISDMEI